MQSQARELSQLRQQIKESRRLGALQRRQLEELSAAFKELMQASEVDYYMGEVVKEQLDKSLGILDRLEGRLDKGSCCLDCDCSGCLLRNSANQNLAAQTQFNYLIYERVPCQHTQNSSQHTCKYGIKFGFLTPIVQKCPDALTKGIATSRERRTQKSSHSLLIFTDWSLTASFPLSARRVSSG